MPAETVKEFIQLKMKESLTGEETRKLARIEESIRYKPSNRERHIPKPPPGPNESSEAYVKRVLLGK